MYGSHLRMFATYAFDEEFPLHGSKGRTDTDPIIPVVHFSTDIHFTGDPIDKRTETDTLYQTLNGQDWYDNFLLFHLLHLCFDKCNPFHKDASYLLLSETRRRIKSALTILRRAWKRDSASLVILCEEQNKRKTALSLERFAHPSIRSVHRWFLRKGFVLLTIDINRYRIW